MPYGDKTGPMGYGPMTGRGAGFCAGYGAPGYMNPVGGRGFRGRMVHGGGGAGRGGRGWRNRFYATGIPGWMAQGYPGMPADVGAPVVPPSPTDEAAFLKNQAGILEQELKALKKRMTELEKQKKEDKA